MTLVSVLTLAGCESTSRNGQSSRDQKDQPVIQTAAVQTYDQQWHGWNAIEQTNGLMTLRHVPAAGGRTLSLEIGGDDAFLVFPNERGKTYPADSRDKSVHFGGHYFNIGPERIWNVHEQPFNPHGGPYAVERDTDSEDKHVLKLTSKPGTWLNATIKVERTIEMSRGNTHVVLHESAINHGPDALEFYIWDFTQIDAVDPKAPDRKLRNLSFYLPVPIVEQAKTFTSFFAPDPEMEAQYDKSLPGDILAIHYKARQFKIASHASQWWVAAVDHDTGWTYIKAFDPHDQAKYVDNNGPIEVYGANRNEPNGGSFVEMELLTGIGRYDSGESIDQVEHWYATICRGPILELTKAGVVCEPLEARRQGAPYAVTGRFGVFYQGTARLRITGHKEDETLYLSEPLVIDPRHEFVIDQLVPVVEDAAWLILEVYDYKHDKVDELGKVRVRAPRTKKED
jgi:hypothetical protein